jgi:hypothetical protein
LGHLQQVTTEKTQQCEELTQLIHQLEVTLLKQQVAGVQNSSKELKFSFQAKFVSTRSQLQRFFNQVRLMIELHPSRYPTDVARVGLIGTLLSGNALAWFAPFLQN